MLLTNHVLTGVLLGLEIDNAIVLVPAGVASHLILDMVPHVGWKSKEPGFRDSRFLIVGTIDFVASIAVVGAACWAWPHRMPHIITGAVSAALPDLTYIPQILFEERLERWLPWTAPMYTFLARIQWYERPPGLLTEALWASLMLGLLQMKLP